MEQSAVKRYGHRAIASACKKGVVLALLATMAAASVTGVASASHASGIGNAGARMASVSLVDRPGQDVAGFYHAWPSKYSGIGY